MRGTVRIPDAHVCAVGGAGGRGGWRRRGGGGKGGWWRGGTVGGGEGEGGRCGRKGISSCCNVFGRVTVGDAAGAREWQNVARHAEPLYPQQLFSSYLRATRDLSRPTGANSCHI